MLLFYIKRDYFSTDEPAASAALNTGIWRKMEENGDRQKGQKYP